jgi:hypothetical protein
VNHLSKAIGMWMTLFLVINFMFTPILSYKDSLEREAVEVVLNEGAKKAAIEGRFTPEIVNEMKQTLVDDYNFEKSAIAFSGTQSMTSRNQYISGSIEVPRGFIFIIDIFNQGPSKFKKEIKVLSEHI